MARPRFTDRLGCVVVVVAALAVLGSILWSARSPRYGLPALLVTAGACVLLLRHASRREREALEREIARLRAIAPPEGDAWRRLFAAEGLGGHVAGLAARARAAARLEVVPGRPMATGGSWLGGAPELPEGMAWPTWKGRSLAFLAQLDLAAAARVLPGSPLPAAGHLLFFYVADQSAWGGDAADRGASAVIFVEDGAALRSVDPPADLPEKARFPVCSIELCAYEDLPDLEDDALAETLAEDEAERYLDLRGYLASGGAGPAHKLLGYPQPIQGSMEGECQRVTNTPGAEWQLLLQLDSDERAGMMWGDAGSLYFWIRPPDLAARRFEEAWLISQCH